MPLVVTSWATLIDMSINTIDTIGILHKRKEPPAAWNAAKRLSRPKMDPSVCRLSKGAAEETKAS